MKVLFPLLIVFIAFAGCKPSVSTVQTNQTTPSPITVDNSNAPPDTSTDAVAVSVSKLASSPNDYSGQLIKVEDFEVTDMQFIPYFGANNLFALGLRAGGKDYAASFSPANNLNFAVNEQVARQLQIYLKSVHSRLPPQNAADKSEFIIADFVIFEKGTETLNFVAVRCLHYGGQNYGDCRRNSDAKDETDR